MSIVFFFKLLLNSQQKFRFSFLNHSSNKCLFLYAIICCSSEKKNRGWSLLLLLVVVGSIYNTARIKFWRYIFWSGTHHIAYFRVHSRASSLYFSRSVLYILAISGTSGSSGLGSQSREQIDNNTKNRKSVRYLWNIWKMKLTFWNR